MSKSTLFTSDQAFYGRGYESYTYGYWDRKGAVANVPTKASLGAAEVADADFLIDAATSTELPDATTITYSASDADASPHDGAAPVTTLGGVTVWDVRDGATYGRNLVSVTTHGSSVVAMTMLISGYDYAGQPMSELHTATATGTTKTVNGTKAFAYVASVAITSAGTATTNTLNIGTGDVLGLPFRLADIGDVISTTIGGVTELVNVASNATVVAGVSTTATTTTGDVRGTITYTTSLDGTVVPVVWYYVAGHATRAGLAGVAQA